jgi:hypothetical protein
VLRPSGDPHLRCQYGLQHRQSGRARAVRLELQRRAERGGAVTVTVERAGGSSGIAIANYGRSDGSAVAGTDYTTTFDSLTWPDGDTTPRTFIVPIAPGGALSIRVQGNELVSTLDGSTVQIVGINISGLETGVNWHWAPFQ